MTARIARTRLGAATRSLSLAIGLAVVPLGSTVVAAQPDTAAGPAGPADAVATSIVVRYRDGASRAAKGRAIAAAHASLERRRTDRAVDVVRPAAGESLEAAIARLEADPAVAYAEPNVALHLAGNPQTEPLEPDQWGLENAGGNCIPTYYDGLMCTPDVDIDAAGAWPTATGAGITVAVLDDGLDFGDTELADQAWVNPGESGMDAQNKDKATNGLDDDGNGYIDDVNGVNLCDDASTQTLHRDGVDWHGTAVASVIGAAANGFDIVGVAPDVRLMAVRWLVEDAGCVSVFDAAKAIDYAVAMGADVINASWGGSDSTLIEEAVADAGAAGVLVVAAAGNEGTSVRFYPAASSAANVLSVGAIGPTGSRASFSNYGTWVDVAAPGAGIVALCESPNSQYCGSRMWPVFGTSFAAPHVAGIAALALQADPSLRPSAAVLRSKLIYSGVKSTKLDDGITGSGRRVNAALAVDVTPPSAPDVRVVAAAGRTAALRSAPFTILWPAATDASGIDGYRLRYRVAGASSWTTLTSWTTARSAAVTLAYGTSYEVQVSARDRGGNTTTTTLTTSPRQYSERSTPAAYTGTWSLASSTSYLGGYARTTTKAGREVSYTITGRSIAWVAAKGPTRGSVDVYVDDVAAGRVSLYASTTTFRRIVWTKSWPTAGPHVVRLVVVGTSGHPRVDVDGMIVAK